MKIEVFGAFFRALSDYGDKFMVFETGGRVFYLGDDYFAPSWWDNWVKGNLKNESKVKSRMQKQFKEE